MAINLLDGIELKSGDSVRVDDGADVYAGQIVHVDEFGDVIVKVAHNKFKAATQQQVFMVGYADCNGDFVSFKAA